MDMAVSRDARRMPLSMWVSWGQPDIIHATFPLVKSDRWAMVPFRHCAGDQASSRLAGPLIRRAVWRPAHWPAALPMQFNSAVTCVSFLRRKAMLAKPGPEWQSLFGFINNMQPGNSPADR